MARKNYTDLFRRQAVDLYRGTNGATLRGIAADLGISRHTLQARGHALDPEVTSASSEPASKQGRQAKRPGAAEVELAELRDRVAALETENTKIAAERDILRQAAKYFAARRTDEPFPVVADRRHAFEVKRLCAVVEVSRSSFYAWLGAAPGRAARVAADASWPPGSARSMRETAPKGCRGSPPSSTTAPRHRRGSTTSGSPGSCAPTLWPRCGYVAGSAPRSRSLPSRRCPICCAVTSPRPAPNQRYVGDITYLPIADGSNLYLATVIDCDSRRLAGWAIAEHMRTDLVTDALGAARDTRGSLTVANFHSDHGAQAVQREDLRRALPAVRGDPVDGRGRYQRRQRVGGVVQRTPRSSARRCRARTLGPTKRRVGGRCSAG
jgi:transposase-like protein